MNQNKLAASLRQIEALVGECLRRNQLRKASKKVGGRKQAAYVW